MIRITYAPAQKRLAQRIRDDLAGSQPATGAVLIVLASAQSMADAHVQAEIQRAQSAGAALLPLRVDGAPMPANLADLRPLDFRGGYDGAALRRRLTPESGGQAALRRANRRGLALVGSLALLVFIAALLSINRGLIAFPVAEYNEEATFQAEWVNGLIRQTLEHVAPGSAEEALHFAATYEAAPTRLHFYIRGTATALPGAQGA